MRGIGWVDGYSCDGALLTRLDFTLLSKNWIQDITFIVVFIFVVIGGVSYLLLLGRGVAMNIY